jgi:hypothetical protein
VVASTKPLAVGIRLQPGPRRDCFSAGLPRHEEGLRQRELPVRCHVVCKAVMTAAPAISERNSEEGIKLHSADLSNLLYGSIKEKADNTQTCPFSASIPYEQCSISQTPLTSQPNPTQPTPVNAALSLYDMQGYCKNRCKTKRRIWYHNQPIRGPDAQSNNRRLTGLGAGSSLAVSCFPNRTALPSA